MTVPLLVIAVLVALESALRLHRWRFAPVRLRLLYASFLLGDEAVRAIGEVLQRVERASMRSFDDLFRLYAAASGRSVEQIEILFGFPMPWRRLIRSPLVLRNRLQWHVGLVPVPGQRLRTATITDAGTRSSGSLPQGPSAPRKVLLTGGSVAYGYGATCDEATIAGRLEYYLNELSPPDQRWEVTNRAFPGATSFQELLAALQHGDASEPPGYVVSVSGCNDVDQQFGIGESNISALAQGYTDSLEQRHPLTLAMHRVGRRFVLLSVLRRLALSYREWPGPGRASTDRLSRASATVPEVDRPDIYPFW